MHQRIRTLVRAALGNARLVGLAGFAVLVVAITLIAACGGSGGGDDNNNNGGATTPCTPGEHRYYCTHSVMAPQGGGEPLSDEWYVSDICGESGDYDFGIECDVNVSGNNVSYSCSFDQNLGDCTLSYDYSVNGTVTATTLDLDGAIEITTSGSCPGGIESGSYVFSVDGTAVDGPGAECGGVAGEAFSLTVTKPGPETLTLSDGQASVTHYAGVQYYIQYIDSDAAGIAYTFYLNVPEFASAPATFDVVLDPTQPDASLAYSELRVYPDPYGVGMNSNTGTITSGTVTITEKTASSIAGTFSITGTCEATVSGSAAGSRTLEGSFDVPINGGFAAPSPSPLPRELRKAMMRTAIGAWVDAGAERQRGITAP